MAATAMALAGIAAATCQPTRSSYAGIYHDLWEAGTDFGNTICEDGSRANIVVSSPYIYSDHDSIWTGIFNPGGTTAGQVGYIKDSGGALYSFDETFFVSGGTQHDTVHNFGPVASGNNPAYEVTYSSNFMHYFINGTNVDNVDLTHSYSGCDSEQGGEIHNKANQLFGTSPSHEVIGNANARNASGETWFTPNWSSPFTSPSVSWLGNSSPQSGELDIWDTCGS
jgi:hypothetical protein